MPADQVLLNFLYQISPGLTTRTAGQGWVSLLPGDPGHAQGGAVEDVPVPTRR